MNKKYIALTLGDPAGIGPELIFKLLEKPIFRKKKLVIVANEFILRETLKLLKKKFPLHKLSQDLNWKKDYLNFFDVQLKLKNQRFQFGKPNKFTSQYAFAFITEAIELAKKGLVRAVVTNPVSKSEITRSGIPFVGHTELFGERTNSKKTYMTFIGPKGMASLLTTHLALKKVSSVIKKRSIIDNFKMTWPVAQKLYGPKIRTAILSFNPHAGESGLFGDEEIKEINPAVRYLKKRFPVDGPFPSDSFWGFLYKRRPYHLILSMYHDQGLIPVKMGVLGKTVNTTLGLPFVRTSVDHGTAYDIAGKNKADVSGLQQAVHYAEKLI